MSIRYADAGDASLAYVAEGSGAHAVIFVPGIVSNLALRRAAGRGRLTAHQPGGWA